MPAFTGNFALHINENWDTTAERKQLVLDALCYHHGYQDEVSNPDNPGEMIPNPESKVAFFNRQIIRFIRGSVHAWLWDLARAELTIDGVDDL